MSPAKVMLSSKEQELVMNTDWILTKNAVIQKVYGLFGLLATAYQTGMEACSFDDREEILQRSPKISKGEQYEGLPWVMLDYPRCYRASDAFGIRTFFWWGNSFSITIQLSGKFQEQYAASIERYIESRNDAADWLTGIGEDPWQHHFREDNYQAITASNVALVTKGSYIKLTKRFPLSDWENMEQALSENFREIISMLGIRGEDQALPKR